MKHRGLIILLSTIFSGPILADEFKGKLATIATGPNLGSVVLVRVENQSASAGWSTSCSSDHYWSYKFDTSVPGGKETYSLLLSAYAAGKEVVINGTGSCTPGVGDDVQDLYYARFNF